MFTPSELEGEVDHSFFDSDGDGGRHVGEKTMEKDLKGEKQIPSTPKRVPAKNPEPVAVDLSPGNRRTRRHLKQVEKNKRGSANDESSASFIPKEPVHEGKDELYLHSKRPSGAFLALLAEMPMDEDNQRPSETRKSPLAFTANSEKTDEQLSKKLVRNQHHKNPIPTSHEASTDADSESSCSSQRGNLSSAKSLVRRKTRRTRRGSAGSQDLLNSTSTDESDDSVTDVSPLSSPDSSSLHSLSSEADKDGHEVQQELGSAPSSGFSNIHQEEGSNPDVDECSFRLESHLEHKLVLHCPRGMSRKNYSFTNEEVRRIDQENQRLLRELSRLSPGLRTGKMARHTSVSNSSSVTLLAPSAVNRQREQRRIECENLAFLKRLQSIKATPALRRSEQLADHQRLTRYPKGAGSGSSRASSALTRPSPVSSRAALTNTDSSSTPVPRSSKARAGSPAWH